VHILNTLPQTSENLEKAKHWLTKAGNQGHALALLELARLHPFETKEAFKTYIKAADLGLPEAQLSLGIIYDKGMGIVQDFEKAFYWYQKAADQGDSTAYYYLGFLYHEGRGVEQDYEKARKLYEKAVKWEVPQAQFNLGTMHLRGEGGPVNHNEAATLFSKAADKEFGPAEHFLAGLTATGQGVEKNIDKAKELWLRAIEHGYYEAYAELGAFEMDQGNKKKSLGYFHEGAKKENANCEFVLGVLYLNGEHVKRNLEEGKNWLNKASDQGHEKAQNLLRSLKQAGNKK